MSRDTIFTPEGRDGRVEGKCGYKTNQILECTIHMFKQTQLRFRFRRREPSELDPLPAGLLEARAGPAESVWPAWDAPT